MSTQLFVAIPTVVVLILLQGCAAIHSNPARTDRVALDTLPATDPALDHYIAWVPRNQAQTATVARALTHISLGNAREQTAEQLCSGARLMHGEVAGIIGPVPVTAPVSAGGYPAWYYRISQRPGLRGCSSTRTQRLYRSLQAHLPAWLEIKTARPQDIGTLSMFE